MTNDVNSLPDGWALVPLSQVSQKKVGQVSPPAPIVYIDIASVDNLGKRIVSPKQLDSGSEIPSRARQLVRAGDVLVSMTRPNLNAVARVGSEHDGAIASTGFDVLRSIGVESDWIFHAVRSPKFVSEMSDLVQGALYPAVRPADIRDFRLPVPPLPEQRRIVAKIEALQERSSRAKQALAEVKPLLEQFRQSILAAAFSGRLTAKWRASNPNTEPASELLHRIRTERRRLWEETELSKFAKSKKKPKDDSWKERYKEPRPLENTDELPDLPQSWVWTNWDNLTMWITYGFTRPMPHVESGPMIVTAKNVKDDGLSLDNVDFTTREAFEALNPKDLPRPGDILIIKDGATTGRAAVVPDGLGQFCINQSVAVVWLKYSPMNRDFLLRWVQSPLIQRLIQEAMAGMAMPHLSITDFARMPIPIPPIEEQHVICKALEKGLQIEESLRRLTIDGDKDLFQLDQSILAKAFRGDLVSQNPSDEPASELLARIRAAKAKTEDAGKGKTLRRKPASTSNELGHVEPGSQPSLGDLLRQSGGRMSVDDAQRISGLSHGDFFASLKEEITAGVVEEISGPENDRYLVLVK